MLMAAPADDFVITVKTNNPGGLPTEFTIVAGFAAGFSFNYNVDCDNDGTNEATGLTDDYTCNYTALGLGPGTYTIRIKDNTGVGNGFPAANFSIFTDVSEKILSVDQWGTGIWRYMRNAFRGAENLVINSNDIPNFSNVTDMGFMFNGAVLADPDTSNWDTSSVNNMALMFSSATSANPDTSNWDTSAVTNMVSMFSSTASANPNTFNWDTSAVTTMRSMFSSAQSANPDTSNWDTSSVTDMSRMFFRAISANPNTSNLDTSLVTDMSNMFESAILANPDTSSWDISKVTTMNRMFAGGPVGIPAVILPTSSYDDMLIGFAAQNVQNNVLFHGGNSHYCSAAAQTARQSLITNNNWTITDAGVCNPTHDFVITIKSDEPGGSPTDFRIVTSGANYNYNVDCDDDGTFEVTAQTGDYTCNYISSGAGIYGVRIMDNSGLGTGYPRPMFNSADVRNKILSVDQWGTAKWSNMNKAFNDCVNLTINATGTPDMSNVSDFRLMFSGASMVNPNTSNWNMSSAQDIAGMFRNATSATPNTSSWDTSLVTDMSFMFNGATAANPNVTNWDTSLVTDMNTMFAGATSAQPIISNWDVSAVTDMSAMFNGLTIPTEEYDLILTNFSVQNLKSNVSFNAGNSHYCSPEAQSARASMVSFNGWTITDGGVCDATIFIDGFESTVVVFKTAESVLTYDFSETDLNAEDETPRLIAVGLDFYNQANIKVYTRLWQGILQIQISYLIDNSVDEITWSESLWQDVEELGLTEISL